MYAKFSEMNGSIGFKKEKKWEVGKLMLEIYSHLHGMKDIIHKQAIYFIYFKSSTFEEIIFCTS